MKKAQTEIIGLLVIVVILIVLAFIFIRLGFEKEPTFTPEMRESSIANNLLLAIIRTNTQYGKMTDFIAESYSKEDYSLLKQQINLILNKALSNKEYQFLMEVNKSLVLQIGTDCKEAVASSQSFPKGDNTYKLTLKIC